MYTEIHIEANPDLPFNSNHNLRILEDWLTSVYSYTRKNKSWWLRGDGYNPGWRKSLSGRTDKHERPATVHVHCPLTT